MGYERDYMNNKCKCKEKNQYLIILDVGIKCTKCFKWIGKVRSRFYKRVSIKKNSKKYNRKKAKNKLHKQLQEE